MNDIERDKLLPKIARLYYLEDMNQEKIAEKFNINRVRVSRYLKKAREKKIVEIKINYPVESYHEIEQIIEKKYDVKECIVVHSYENPKDILKEMATALTNVLLRILREGDYIGVNWGLTLKGISECMNAQNRIGVKVVPIVGGMGVVETGIHTNSIAKNFADILGGTSYIINAPAILDSREAREVLVNDSNAREIFELQTNIVCSIFSFSDLGPESSYAKYGFIGPDNLEYLKSLGIVGDVNLNFIDGNGEPVANRLNDRVVALPITEIKKIRNSIGIAYGLRKNEVTKAVLKGRIVNILIIDRDIAEDIISEE
jgi:DNA-binding transcriptional regulator LsrR (DeoR family)